MQLDFRQLVELWNKKSAGWLRKKSERLIDSFYNDKKYKPRILDSLSLIATEEEWNGVIDEILKNFDDEFWQDRKGMHGLEFLFQRRQKGEGEYNYKFYFEKYLTSKEEVEVKKDEYNKLFH